jgi:hypothetical protein
MKREILRRDGGRSASKEEDMRAKIHQAKENEWSARNRTKK